MATFPSADSVSPDWLTAQLHANGIDGQVVDFTAARVGTGQVGMCQRYELRYAEPVPGAPATLVAKFASDDPTSRATGVLLRNYIKEVSFYQQMQGRLGIRTPKCYFADIVDEGPEFIVLMEDLAPAEQGNQLEGTSPDIARAAVLELVGLHAPGWRDHSLQDLRWLVGDDSALEKQHTNLYAHHLPSFIDRYGAHLSDDQRRIIKRVGEAADTPLNGELPEHFSLVHIDYRLDNMMILPVADGYEITVVDWQSISLGAPLNDVAYFMGAGLLPEVRAEVEEDIVRAYHQALLAAGVERLGWEECWHGYRRGVFAGFAVTVIASMVVQQTERGDKMFIAMAQRHAQHALDLGSEEFLRD
ncbi:MAG: phosphotransferase [Pseudomonadota bacterium]